MITVAEFKEFERRFKFKPRFEYGWFHLKLYQMFQDLKWVLVDLNRGSNSLNSISRYIKLNLGNIFMLIRFETYSAYDASIVSNNLILMD